ncbi:MAG: DUF4493 domain-containing protein [Alistipes sp.]|nr:DUF4493 domain-containing protein [Alistipes sp.]
MKSIVKLMSLVMLMSLGISSCNRDSVGYEPGTQTDNENVGYLALGQMEATILEDTENISTNPGTRAGNVDINTFDVVITNKDGEEVASYKYGELPSEPIALDAGVYKVTMMSEAMVGAEWEKPVYGAEREVIITRKQTTTVNDIVCKLRNIKVTVDYAADLKSQLDANYTSMTVALAENELVYGFNEVRGGYFAPVAAENTLVLTFKCRYAGTTKDIVMTNEITGVKAAQWRKINVVVQHAADGTANIGIVCDTWTYDEEVVFDTSVSLFEEILVDDTDLPVINFEGHDLAEPFELTDAMFDADGKFTSNINIDITAKSAIQSIIIKASSDNPAFITAYNELVPTELDICDGSVNNTLLGLMGYPTSAKGSTSTRIKFGAQADILRTYEGTHSFEITATDANGGKTTSTLAIKYGQMVLVPPSIVWSGYDISQRHTYALGMTCDLHITAEGGIADFIVEIISNDLTDTELQGVGLAAKFSLINDTQFFGALDSLGFPTGDSIKGAKELDLSITSFLSILSMSFPGDHDFRMSVTDAAGQTTTETIMLHFN